MELVIAIGRSVVVVTLMASTTFVLGTVVGYQYHALILKFSDPDNVSWDRNYRRLVLRWYKIGIPSSLIVVYVIGLWKITFLAYLLALAGLVLVFWSCWLVNYFRVVRKQLSFYDANNDLDTLSELSFSSFSLSLISAFFGITIVEKVFKLFHWTPGAF